MTLPRRQLHPPKKAVRKSKKSCELISPSSLKSAVGSVSKNAARKSKKSYEFATPLQLKSAAQIVNAAGSLVASPQGFVPTIR